MLDLREVARPDGRRTSLRTDRSAAPPPHSPPEYFGWETATGSLPAPAKRQRVRTIDGPPLHSQIPTDLDIEDCNGMLQRSVSLQQTCLFRPQLRDVRCAAAQDDLNGGCFKCQAAGYGQIA